MCFYLSKWTGFSLNVFYLLKLAVFYDNRQQSNARAGQMFSLKCAGLNQKQRKNIVA